MIPPPGRLRDLCDLCGGDGELVQSSRSESTVVRPPTWTGDTSVQQQIINVVYSSLNDRQIDQKNLKLHLN